MKTISAHDGKNLDMVVTDLEKKLDKASIDEVISDYLDEHPIQEYDPRLPQTSPSDAGKQLIVDNFGDVALVENPSYTKTESDGKYRTVNDSYSKNESDGKYRTVNDSYSKTESDGKYRTVNDSYSKTESDGKYRTVNDSYSKTESDNRYYNINEIISGTEEMEDGVTPLDTGKIYLQIEE